MRFAASLLLTAAACAVGSADAGLVGTQVSLRTIAQASQASVPMVTSFERSVTVSASQVEYPDVASLFNPGSPVPPGFARSLVNVAVDIADWHITIDFRNAGSSRYASGFQNTYAFRFAGATGIATLAPQIDIGATTLGLDPGDVTMAGNELFINVESLPFDHTTFVRINLLDVASGVPTAVFSGPRSNYRIEKRGANWRVTDLVGTDGSATLTATQRLRFADYTFELVNPAVGKAPTYATDDRFLFDGVFYLIDNAELAPTVSLPTAWQHFVVAGGNDGRRPTSWFDAEYYEWRWPDLAALALDDVTLFRHFNLYGVWEGRSPGPLFDQFDGERYLHDNPDVANYVGAFIGDFLGNRTNGAIAHFIIYGANERRNALDRMGRPIVLDYASPAPPAPILAPTNCAVTVSPTSLPATGGAVAGAAHCTGGGAATSWLWTRAPAASATMALGSSPLITDQLPGNDTATAVTYTYTAVACNQWGCSMASSAAVVLAGVFE